MKRSMLVAAWLLVVAGPLVAAAQEGANVGRIRSVEGSVSIQRAGESATAEVEANTPFSPGDRLFTADPGRLEVQFGRTFVRIDSRTSLELGASDPAIAMQLNAGGLYIHNQGGNPVAVSSPAGSVDMQEPGIYRIDSESGETRLSVIQGRALIDSGNGPLTVEAGQKVYFRKGQPPEGPQAIGRLEDDFAGWDRDHEGRVGGGGESRRYVPEAVAPYTSDLDSNGSWSYGTDVGSYVWHPYVAEDWSPYSNGSWGWTSFGWTWNPYETWGWAPFHYGRWGFSTGLGWYWIPGATWGPAWVSWSFGGGLVGWAPLGFHDRVFGFGAGRFWRGGLGFPHGGLGVVPRGTVGGWNFARAGDLTAHNLSQLRQSPSAVQLQGMRTASAAQQPNRNFSGTRAVPAASAIARTRPTIGDSVPELRRNWNQPAVPRPTVPGVGTPLTNRGLTLQGTRSNTRPKESRPAEGVTAHAATPHPTDVRGGARPGEDFPLNRGGGHVTDRRDTFSERSRGSNEQPNRGYSGGRDVLRPFFQNFGERKDSPRGSSSERPSGNTHPSNGSSPHSNEGSHPSGGSHPSSSGHPNGGSHPSGSSGHSSGGSSHSSGASSHSSGSHHGR